MKVIRFPSERIRRGGSGPGRIVPIWKLQIMRVSRSMRERARLIEEAEKVHEEGMKRLEETRRARWGAGLVSEYAQGLDSIEERDHLAIFMMLQAFSALRAMDVHSLQEELALIASASPQEMVRAGARRLLEAPAGLLEV